jgi:hypothetical protein
VSIETAHHDGYAALPDGFAQAREFGAISHLRVELIVGHDVPMLKVVGGAAVELHLECVYLVQLFKLGVCDVKRCSSVSFFLMLSSFDVCLRFVVLLIGLTERGTAPDGCHVAADSASQSGPSRCKTLRYLVKAFPLAGLLLVFRVSSLITPCSKNMQLWVAAFH